MDTERRKDIRDKWDGTYVRITTKPLCSKLAEFKAIRESLWLKSSLVPIKRALEKVSSHRKGSQWKLYRFLSFESLRCHFPLWISSLVYALSFWIIWLFLLSLPYRTFMNCKSHAGSSCICLIHPVNATPST